MFEQNSYRGPYIYRLKIEDGKIIARTAEDGTPHFKAPVTNNGKKIYLVGTEELHYVGITSQPMRDRLRQGVKPNTESGYHGYQWLKEDGEHTIAIFCFDNDSDLETIEAEIVYLFRNQTDQWPKHQTEIHFHQSEKSHREIAKKILDESPWR